MRLRDVNLFQPNVEVSLIKTQAIVYTGRLLQEGADSGEFTSTVNFEDQGITAQVQSDSSLTIVVDPVALTDYIVSVDPEAARLL